MSDAVLLALIGAIPATLTGLATLFYVLKGNRLIDGKMSELIEHVGASKKIEGKVEILTEIAKPKIVDRRAETRPEPPSQP